MDSDFVVVLYRYRCFVPPVTSAGAGRQVRTDAAARQSPAALASTTRRDTPHYYRHVRGATLICCSIFQTVLCYLFSAGINRLYITVSYKVIFFINLSATYLGYVLVSVL